MDLRGRSTVKPGAGSLWQQYYIGRGFWNSHGLSRSKISIRVRQGFFFQSPSVACSNFKTCDWITKLCNTKVCGNRWSKNSGCKNWLLGREGIGFQNSLLVQHAESKALNVQNIFSVGNFRRWRWVGDRANQKIKRSTYIHIYIYIYEYQTPNIYIYTHTYIHTYDKKRVSNSPQIDYSWRWLRNSQLTETAQTSAGITCKCKHVSCCQISNFHSTVACFAASVAGRKLKQRDVMNAKHLSLVMNERNARRRLAEIAVLPCKR